MSSAQRLGPRLLVVDDNDDDVELLRIALKRTDSGLVLSVEKSGEAALRRLAAAVGAKLPDVVLLDWKMPGISGAEVLKAIREAPTTHHLPVVVLSSSEAPDDLRVATALGATGYLPKPADMGGYLALARSLDEAWCGATCPRS
ncbi:MAG: response regulator [Pseudomonadota bacterium]|nr:response regulator [Pseudomonadota bacterium]